MKIHKTKHYAMYSSSDMHGFINLILGCITVRGHRRTLLFGSIHEDIKREKLFQVICFHSQVLGIFLLRMCCYGATLFALAVVKKF
jgi:hypothetical protein